MGADKIGAVRRGVKLGREGRGAALGRSPRPVTAARNDLRDTETMTGSPNILFQSPRPAKHPQRCLRPGAQKKPHAGIEDQPLAGDAGALEPRQAALGEKLLDPPPHLVRPEIEPTAPGPRPAPQCITTSRHVAAARSG